MHSTSHLTDRGRCASLISHSVAEQAWTALSKLIPCTTVLTSTKVCVCNIQCQMLDQQHVRPHRARDMASCTSSWGFRAPEAIFFFPAWTSSKYCWKRSSSRFSNLPLLLRMQILGTLGYCTSPQAFADMYTCTATHASTSVYAEHQALHASAMPIVPAASMHETRMIACSHVPAKV